MQTEAKTTATKDAMMKVIYESFDPLKIRFEDVPKGKVLGEVSICITDVRMKVVDLSMGMKEMEGWGYWSTIPVFQVLVMTLEKPGATISKLQKMAHGIAGNVEKIDKTVREKFAKGLL